jgi:hypothetical protein
MVARLAMLVGGAAAHAIGGIALAARAADDQAVALGVAVNEGVCVELDQRPADGGDPARMRGGI